jgi:mono/diheme cytochrome c family protein
MLRSAAYGPFVGPETIALRGEARVRTVIMQGTTNMPGWQYALSRAQLDAIIAYLKVAGPRIYSPDALASQP